MKAHGQTPQIWGAFKIDELVCQRENLSGDDRYSLGDTHFRSLPWPPPVRYAPNLSRYKSAHLFRKPGIHSKSESSSFP